MEPIHLYTENFFFWSRVKAVLKFFLGRFRRGPQAVERSLIAGLKELGQPYAINQKPGRFDVACVLSGVPALRRAILWKQRGLAKKILAGPNLVVNPNDRDKIIQHPSVDIILQPSQWTSDVYASLAPSISQKIRVWPAGVAISPLSQSLKTIDFLVYNKIGNNPLFLGILRALQEKNYNCEVFNYGHFKQAEYFHALEHSKAVIYLSESESQGLAMLEAWARGVPAFVWERGFWKNGGYIYEGNTASPYADPENGMRFKDLADFSKLLSEFVQAVFHPRKFVEKNFSDKAAAQKYLDIVNELKD